MENGVWTSHITQTHDYLPFINFPASVPATSQWIRLIYLVLLDNLKVSLDINQVSPDSARPSLTYPGSIGPWPLQFQHSFTIIPILVFPQCARIYVCVPHKLWVPIIQEFCFIWLHILNILCICCLILITSKYVSTGKWSDNYSLSVFINSTIT